MAEMDNDELWEQEEPEEGVDHRMMMHFINLRAARQHED